jgi:hypothetical protein
VLKHGFKAFGVVLALPKKLVKKSMKRLFFPNFFPESYTIDASLHIPEGRI